MLLQWLSLRYLTNDGGEWEETGCSEQQMAQTNIRPTYLLEGQDYNQGGIWERTE